MSSKDNILEFFANIGADEMLIQGAGGNASWKSGSTMWIKASGTWLADSTNKDIFVPVDIAHVAELIAGGVDDLSSACIGDTHLRPSIETCLHVLLKQQLVVHLHAVDVIALAVLKNGEKELSRRLNGLNWAWVDYVKPGPELARAVEKIIGDRGPLNVLVLGNHGIVIAADSLGELQHLMADILFRCKTSVREAHAIDNNKLLVLAEQWESLGYVLPKDDRCHTLALDPVSLQLCALGWVLYPDHAVFLGASASIIDSPVVVLSKEHLPECYIVPGCGVVVRNDLSSGQLAMLNCYSAVAQRIASIKEISPLTSKDISDLLNWDAEKYRKSLNNK